MLRTKEGQRKDSNFFLDSLSLCILYNNIARSDVGLWNMDSYIKGGTKAKGFWKQDPDVNTWSQEGWEWGLEKFPQ